MNMQNLTQKSIESLNLATTFAKENGNSQINSLHLLKRAYYQYAFKNGD